MRANDSLRTGGEILIDQLVIHGARHMFCVPGESYIAALDACHGRELAVTICRHESGAAIMAEAVGKATGRPGICFVTRGPGATNASAGVHIARQDSTPMILFVGQVARHMREREAFQELDYRAVFGTIAKWATEIDDPARIPELVSRAYYTATSGRPGPVVIALPEDMLTERVAVADAPAFEPVETWPGLTDMSRLQKMIWAAERPIVLLGGSRWSEAACASVARFAERFALPVATTFRRAHLFDPDHPCYAGDLGIGPEPEAARAREGRRPDRPGRRAARRDAVAGLHAARHSGAEPEARARVSRRRRAWPRLSRRACDQRRADRVRGRARRLAAAERSALERRHADRARRFPRLDRQADESAGRGQHGRDRRRRCARSFRPTR